MPEKLWLAHDSRYGVQHIFQAKHPRKWLLDMYYRKHADKIYRDKKNGPPVHVGWIVNGHWFNVFELIPMEKPF